MSKITLFTILALIVAGIVGFYVVIMFNKSEVRSEQPLVTTPTGSEAQSETLIGTKIGSNIRPCNWVFKTSGDYSAYLSGVLNDDKTRVLSVPLFAEIKRLQNGYYTSITGCSSDFTYTKAKNVVFFTKTLKEWNSENEHDMNALLNIIKDDHPFQELYFCPSSSIEKLNSIIKKGELADVCQKII